MESRRVPRRVVKCNLKKEASLPALRTPVHPVLGQRPEKEAESSGLVYNSARKEQLFRTLFSTNPHLRSRLIPGIETPSYLTSWYAFLHTYAHPRGALYNPYNEPSIYEYYTLAPVCIPLRTPLRDWSLRKSVLFWVRDFRILGNFWLRLRLIECWFHS